MVTAELQHDQRTLSFGAHDLALGKPDWRARYSPIEHTEPEITPDTPDAFFEAIGRPELADVITKQSPWVYLTMEFYDEKRGIKGNGGLGMLASDTYRTARKLGIPMVLMTPFYTHESKPSIYGFEQKENFAPVSAEARGFTPVIVEGEPLKVAVKTEWGYGQAELDVYEKQEGSVRLVTLTEPNFGELYAGDVSGDKRLYQEVALGFGGYKAMQALGIEESGMRQLNEAPTIFAAIARLDDLIGQGASFEEALQEVRATSLYTNHTLVQAVEGKFTRERFEKYVLPNIADDGIKAWLMNMFNMTDSGELRLSSVALELSDKANGVSRIHAREANKEFKHLDGRPVNFEGVTNGISIERWGDPQLLSMYRREGILDEHGLPIDGFEERLAHIDPEEIQSIKVEGRLRMRDVLLGRLDQYGNPIDIPEESKVFNWKRRLASYKRPHKPFRDLDRLAGILEGEDSYLIMTGRAHPNDWAMREFLTSLLYRLDNHDVLRERVRFVQGYDEDVARALSQGADISLNTPTVWDDNYAIRKSTEACGTSWAKDILNNGILISTDDGGVADPSVVAEDVEGELPDPAYLRIEGRSEAEELEALYRQMMRASAIVDGRDPQHSWDQFVRLQTAVYLPVISDARMMKDYVNLVFPQQNLTRIAA